MNDEVNEYTISAEYKPPQPEFTLNPVSVIADSFEPEFEISEEVLT
jgi:hypothetical protein